MLKDVSIHRPIWMGFDDLKHIVKPSYDSERRVQAISNCAVITVVVVRLWQCVCLLQGLLECSSSESETNDAELELWQDSRLMVGL